MKFDLHCHSTASDGKLAPIDVLQQATACDLDIFALTDHDTLAGYEALLASAVNKPRYFVSGIEISTQWQGKGIHIIGLDFDHLHPAILAMVARQRQVREMRAHTISERLAKLGMPNCLEGALTYCPDIGQVGRPHFAEYLLSQGYVKSSSQAFDKWLGNGKIGDVKSAWPEVVEAVQAIAEAGGVSVLAHPLKYNMTFSKLGVLLDAFAAMGGHGVEVVDRQADVAKKNRLQHRVHSLGLAASGGSDFHDPAWAWAQLGRVDPLPEHMPAIWQLFCRTPVELMTESLS